ncbi:MAG: hypothetical protein ACXABY_05545 [Candidatus Thorarchaeota archaeon]|jgi:hypothetical protein
MPEWTHFNYNNARDGERECISVYPIVSLEPDYELGSPGFAPKPVPLQYIALFDPCPDESDAYELIMGSEQGSGAIAMPEPVTMMPFRERKLQPRELRTKLRRFPPIDIFEREIAGESLSDTHKKDKLTQSDRLYWGIFSDMLKVYSTGAAKKQRTCMADIPMLKKVIDDFSEALMDKGLPKTFRKGVEYINNSSPAEIINKFHLAEELAAL